MHEHCSEWPPHIDGIYIQQNNKLALSYNQYQDGADDPVTVSLGYNSSMYWYSSPRIVQI